MSDHVHQATSIFEKMWSEQWPVHVMVAGAVPSLCPLFLPTGVASGAGSESESESRPTTELPIALCDVFIHLPITSCGTL